MILVWNNINAFQRHLEDMKLFSRAHSVLPPGEQLKTLPEIPVPLNIASPCQTKPITGFTNARGKMILVPIWKMTLSKGSQN